MTQIQIPGYTYDQADASSTASSNTNTITAADLAELEQSVLWGEADAQALERAGKILVPRTDAILDVWYGFVGGHSHLVATFAGADGEPDPAYLTAVRARFGQWISDLCHRSHDATWLAYQEEIARRHTSGKNETDQVTSTAPHVPLRHLIGLIVPITITIRDFLAEGSTSPEDLDEMYNAWFKAVTLTVALWAKPYSPELW